MTLDNSVQIGLRLLEAIYLLLPVVAILLQTMIGFYTNEGESISTVRKTISLILSTLGFLLLIISGLIVIVILFDSGVRLLLVIAAIVSLFGLATFGIALGLLVRDVLSEIESTVDQHEHSTSRKKVTQGQPENIEPTSEKNKNET